MHNGTRLRRNIMAAIMAGAALVAVSVPCGAQDAPAVSPPSPENGLALAQKLCVNCHLLPDVPATVPAGPPTFRGIANKPGQTGDKIVNVLIQPHAPMPDIHLTNAEMRDLLAYLETLRTDKAAPALRSPVEPDTTPPAPKRS